MQKQTFKDFDYYFQRNQFKRGSKQLIRNFRKARFAEQGERLIDGIRLLLIAKGPVAALKVLKKHQKIISRSGPCAGFRMSYLQAEIAWQRGYYAKVYSILLQLRNQLTVSASTEENPMEISRSFQENLLADIDLLAGKCMAHENDHAMARIHFGRSYNHRHWKKKAIKDFSDGQVRVLFARSYFNWRKMGFIEELLKKAEYAYGSGSINFAEGAGPHFHLAKVYTLQARYQIIKGLRKIGLKDNSDSRTKKRRRLHQNFNAKLKDAKRVILSIFDKKHRCYAHIIRLRALFDLEFLCEDIKENKGIISRENYNRLLKIDRRYKKEIKIRKRFFGTRCHPSIARASANQAKARMLMAVFFGQQGQAHQMKEVLKKAELSVQRAVKANGKTVASQIPELKNRAFGDTFINQHPELAHQLSDTLVLEVKKRALEIYAIKYAFADLLKIDKAKQYKRAKKMYKKCEQVLSANLKWVTSPDSKESLFEIFEQVQEVFIEVSFDEFSRSGSKDKKIIERALRAMDQGRPNEEVNKYHDEKKHLINEHQKRLRLLQTYVSRRLEEEGDIEESISHKSVLDEYHEMTEQVFLAHQNLVRHRHESQTVGKSALKKGGKKPFDFAAISAGFKSGDEGVAIALHFGNKHAYSIAIRDDSRVSFIRLTSSDQPYTGVLKLKRLAKSFNRLVSRFYDLSYWKTLSADPTANLTKAEVERIETKIFRTDKFIYDPDSKELSDRLNSRFLLQGYKIYEQVLQKLDLNPDDRVYIGINRYRWQRIPLRAVFTRDPEIIFTRGQSVSFSRNSNHFIGTRQQLSVLPSVFELWRWQKGNPKQSKKPVFPNNEFYALAGGSDDEQNSYFKQAAEESTDEVTDFFKEGYRRTDGKSSLKAINRMPAIDTPKADILKEFENAAFIYAFLHTAREYNEDGRRKMVLYAKAPPAIRKELVANDAFIWDERCIYQEEISGCRLEAVRLAFINSCLSADGRGSFGYVPYSTLSALYAAGCKVVIGTQIKTYAVAMREFAKNFYTYWMNKGERNAGQFQNLSIGEAIMRSSEVLANSPHLHCTHPLHWGAYIQIGDMTTRFEDCINK